MKILVLLGTNTNKELHRIVVHKRASLVEMDLFSISLVFFTFSSCHFSHCGQN